MRARGCWPFPLLLAALLLLALPGSAAAHAVIQETTPSNESTVDAAPDRIALKFSEPVSTSFGGIKAYGPSGKRIDSGKAKVDGRHVTIAIDDAGKGTHAVSWRVISADGHSVRGAFVFHVGAASGDTSTKKALAASQVNRPAAIGFGIARGALIAGVLLAAGGAFFAAYAAPGWRPRWMGVAIVLALAGMLAGYVFDAAAAAGFGVTEVLDPAVLREQAGTVYGRATLVRLGWLLVALGGAALLTRAAGSELSRGRRLVLAVLFAGMAASLSLSGHSIGEKGLRLPIDMLHSIAAAAWLGGLVQLIAFLRSSQPSAQRVAVVNRYSNMALVAVLVLVVTGLYAMWVEIGLLLDGLLQTTYGRLVLVKLGLFALTMPLAVLNRWWHVPAIADGEATSARKLRRFAQLEVGILFFVIVTTAWLIQVIPAKDDLRPELFDRTYDLRAGASVQVVIDPAAQGRNEIHAYALDKQQRPDTRVTSIRLLATNKKRGIGPLDLGLIPAGPGHASAPEATLPYSGRWEFVASIERGEFEEEKARFVTEIAPAQASP